VTRLPHGIAVSTGRLVVGQLALVLLVAFGVYLLVRGRDPWPGVAVLVVAAIIEAVLVVLAVRHRPRHGADGVAGTG
jgi:hypothetical protein